MIKLPPAAPNKLGYYLAMGICIVLAVIGLIIFSYIIVIGAIIGLALFGLSYLRQRFFMPPKKSNKKQGKLYDHSEFK